MQNYLDLLQDVLDNGVEQENRTGINTLMIPGIMLKYNLKEGFPVCTTRKAAPKSAMGEMVAFIQGCDNASQFRALKCGFWNKNANENKDWLANPNRKGEDDLGRIYGVQYRKWRGKANKIEANPVSIDGENILFNAEVEYEEIDQLKNAIDLILNNPTSRRIIVSAWNPSDADTQALPPCHFAFQFMCDVTNKKLHLSVYHRSWDLFLGAPANLIEYAFLLEVVAQATGYDAGVLTYFSSDNHIYTDHIPFVKEQLTRTPYQLPTLKNNKPFTGERTAEAIVRHLEGLHPDDFELVGYQHHPAIEGAKMAV